MFNTNAIKQSQQLMLAQPLPSLKNPYVIGSPARTENPTVFWGREDIVQAIREEIRKGPPKTSLLLYGRRQMGKTSVLYHLRRLVDDIRFVENLKFIDVYIDAQSASTHTDVDFCYYLVKAVIKRLQEVLLINKDAFPREGFLERQTFLNNPVRTLSEFFEDCHALLTAENYYCLIAIDEYEEIDFHINPTSNGQHQNNLSRDLLLEFRHILQHLPRFMFLFAGTHYLKDLFVVNWLDIFINVKIVHMSFLDQKAGYNLLTKPVPELRYEDEQLIQNILDMTGCQPFLLQAIASELIMLLNQKRQWIVQREILEEAITAFLSNWNNYFDYIWQSECPSPRHQELLQIIANKDASFSESQLSDYERELKELIQKEILKIEKGTITLTMPIIKDWMKRNKHLLKQSGWSELRPRVIDFLSSLPNIIESSMQRTLIADLDQRLQDLIHIGGARKEFVSLLVSTLENYGTLDDGQHALIALLESAQKYVGSNRQAECNKIILELRNVFPCNNNSFANM